MQLLMPSSILRKMRGHMLMAGPREIGGLIMGEEVAQGQFRIVDFSVDMKRGTWRNFVRDSGYHDKVLADFFEKTGANFSRFNYLGEWHTHPCFSVHPSVKDMHTMQDLVDGSGGVDFAVLLIARLRWFLEFECSAHLFIKGHVPAAIKAIREDRSATLE